MIESKSFGDTLINSAIRRSASFSRLSPTPFDSIMKTRDEVERIFSALTCFGGGLAPLPSWVRRLDRVQRWVTVKIIIYHARLFIRKAA